MNNDRHPGHDREVTAPAVTAALGPSTFRAAEVITVTINPTTTIADIAHLFAAASRQDDPLPGLAITGLKLSWTCWPTNTSTAPANASPAPAPRPLRADERNIT